MSRDPVVCIGWDTREDEACRVAVASMKRHASRPVEWHALNTWDLEDAGLYLRQVHLKRARMWDPPSKAHMSTEHANARFLIPFIFRRGWVLWTDGDVMYRDDIHKLFALRDDRYAVMCVQHDQQVGEDEQKKAGDVQLAYARKNWSSVMLWNLDHPANKKLTLHQANTMPGRDLHRFFWLPDEAIGALPPEWNYLVGESPKLADPKLAHFTMGLPSTEGYSDCEFAAEWRCYRYLEPKAGPPPSLLESFGHQIGAGVGGAA